MNSKSASRGVWLACIVAAFGVLSPARDVGAQSDFPTKSITLITPGTAGAPDVLIRSVAEGIRTRTGATVAVESRVGAAGAIAAVAIASAKPDGYTIGMLYSGALIASPLVNKDLNYDPIKSFEPISMLARAGTIWVAAPSFPANNFAEVLKLAKSRSAPLSVSIGSMANKLALLAIADAAGVKFLEVPVTTSASLHGAILSGSLDIGLEAPGSVLGFIKEGREKALVTGDLTREPLYPDVGTINDVLPGKTMTIWFALLAPAGTPKDRLALLERVTRGSLDDPQMKAKISAAGFNVVGGASKDLADEIRATRDQFEKVVRQYGISQ